MKLSVLYTLLILASTFMSTAQLDRSKAPEAQPNPVINIPTPNVFTLDNGLQVIVVENHKQPKVSFQLYVDHAPLVEGKKVGLSSMFGELLGSGTKSVNKEEFDETIDFMGASFSPSSRGFFASSLSKHTPQLLSLLSKVVLEPAFTESEFDRIKNQNKSAMAYVKSDASSMAQNVSDVVNYGEKHPYGEVVTEKTIDAITLNDVKNHYASFFKPNFAYLVIVGDINEATAQEYANKYFGEWKKGDEPNQNYADLASSKGNNVYFVDKPGAVQSVINISQNVNIKPGHEDEIKLKVLNAILGGGSFSARLFSNLREDKAYTYGCYSTITSDELIGSFTAGGSFRSAVTDSAVTQILMEINLISNNLVKDTELDLVKRSMTGAFARSLENPQTVARFALNTIRYNLPANYYATYLQKLENVTKDDVLMAASEYLSPKNLNIIIVGNSEIASTLAIFDADGKITYKDAFGNNVTPLIKVKEGVTAESVINNFMLKTFIVDSEEAIKTKLSNMAYVETRSTSFIAQMNTNLVVTSYKATPNKSALIIQSESGEMIFQKEWFNGEKGGSTAMMQPSKDYTEDEIADKKNASFPFAQLHYFTNKSYAIELLGIAEIDDVKYYKLKVSKEGEEEFSFEYYNVETGMLDLNESFRTDDEGNSVTVITYFKDYTVYSKKKTTLMIPALSIIDSNGQKMEFKTESVIVKKKSKSTAFDGEF